MSAGRGEIARMLGYFWTEKGDLSRWVGFGSPDVEREFPDVVRAWRAYKDAEALLGARIAALPEEE